MLFTNQLYFDLGKFSLRKIFSNILSLKIITVLEYGKPSSPISDVLSRIVLGMVPSGPPLDEKTSVLRHREGWK